MPAASRNPRSLRSTGATPRAGAPQVSRSTPRPTPSRALDVVPAGRLRELGRGHARRARALLECRPSARLGLDRDRVRRRRPGRRSRCGCLPPAISAPTPNCCSPIRKRRPDFDYVICEIHLRRQRSRRRPRRKQRRAAAGGRGARRRRGGRRAADPGLRGRAHPGTDRRSGRPDGARRGADGADLSRFAAGDPRHRGVPPARRRASTPTSTSSGCFDSPHLRFTETVDESKAIAKLTGFHIIIAASGMCDAGRIRHHLKRWLWQQRRRPCCWSAFRPAARSAGSSTMARRRCASRARKSRSPRASAGSTNIPAMPTAPSWRAGSRRGGRFDRGVFLVHGEEPAIAGLAERHRRAASIPAAQIFHAGSRRHLRALDAGADAARRRAAAAGSRRKRWSQLDWHNDMSKLILDINDRIEAAADDRARGVIMRRLRRALEAGEG